MSGEPGIGKTRTVEEIAANGGASDMLVLWASIHDERGAPALRPWAQMIRRYVRDSSPEALRAALGANSGIVAGIVPEVEEKIGKVAAPEALGDPDAERFRLCEAVTGFLKSAA